MSGAPGATLPRRVAVFTGTRAEYGLLHWLLRGLDDDPAADLAVIVGGMHLSPEFGLTVRDVEADGLPIVARVEMLLSSDTPVGVAKSVGLGVLGVADALAAARPDVLVVLGDRFEVLAAAQAALLLGVPVAHVHGGEVTEGAVDESIRHAVTKMAHLHFTAAERFRRRVLQLGEDPARVHVVGAPGLDWVARLDPLPRADLEAALGLPLTPPVLLVTYHPATAGDEDPEEAVGALLAALDRLPEATVVATGSNADAGGRAVRRALEAWASGRQGATVHGSLGQRRYLSLLARCDAVVGNSSSGIIEAPALGTPTVDVGTRQRGRPRATSVTRCPVDAAAIERAVRAVLDPDAPAHRPDPAPPYGRGGASDLIKSHLLAADLTGITLKRFHDLGDRARRDGDRDAPDGGDGSADTP